MSLNAITLFCLLIGTVHGITELTDDTFYDYANSKDYLLVDFYAPWCSDSKRLAPELEIAAQYLGKRSGDLVKVDCFGPGKGLCQTFNIKHWPTLKTFHRGQFISEYNGPKTAEALSSYVSNEEDEYLIPQSHQEKTSHITITGYKLTSDTGHKVMPVAKDAQVVNTENNYTPPIPNAGLVDDANNAIVAAQNEAVTNNIYQATPAVQNSPLTNTGYHASAAQNTPVNNNGYQANYAVQNTPKIDAGSNVIHAVQNTPITNNGYQAAPVINNGYQANPVGPAVPITNTAYQETSGVQNVQDINALNKLITAVQNIPVPNTELQATHLTQNTPITDTRYEYPHTVQNVPSIDNRYRGTFPVQNTHTNVGESKFKPDTPIVSENTPISHGQSEPIISQPIISQPTIIPAAGNVAPPVQAAKTPSLISGSSVVPAAQTGQFVKQSSSQAPINALQQSNEAITEAQCTRCHVYRPDKLQLTVECSNSMKKTCIVMQENSKQPSAFTSDTEHSDLKLHSEVRIKLSSVTGPSQSFKKTVIRKNVSSHQKTNQLLKKRTLSHKLLSRYPINQTSKDWTAVHDD